MCVCVSARNGISHSACDSISKEDIHLYSELLHKITNSLPGPALAPKNNDHNTSMGTRNRRCNNVLGVSLFIQRCIQRCHNQINNEHFNAFTLCLCVLTFSDAVDIFSLGNAPKIFHAVNKQ